METLVTDVLINFYAGADEQDEILAKAFLEPLTNTKRDLQTESKAKTSTASVKPGTSTAAIVKKKPQPSTEITKTKSSKKPKKPKTKETHSEDIVLLAFIAQIAFNKALQGEESNDIADEDLAEIQKKLDEIHAEKIKKDAEEQKKRTMAGHEAFLKEHNLLPKMIVHPQMTLKKILNIYPELPLSKDLDPNLLLKETISKWLPLLSTYSGNYANASFDNVE